MPSRADGARRRGATAHQIATFDVRLVSVTIRGWPTDVAYSAACCHGRRACTDRWTA